MKHFKIGRHAPARRTAQPWILLAAGLVMCAPVWAQGADGGPRNGGGPMDGGPDNRGDQRGGPRGGERGDRSQRREQMLKRQLERAGYDDATLQNAVLACVQTKESGRATLYQAANALSNGLSDENTTDAQIGTLYDAFAVALVAEKTRVQNAEKQLDTQIKFSADKRLRAVLTLSGVIGDAMGYLEPGGRGGSPPRPPMEDGD